jgi:teichuronic acid biosynthesis glycosyltransferase TuaG
MWLVILKKIEIAHPLPKSLASYRIRKGSISASKLDLLAHNFAVYHQFHRLNKVVSALCMMGFLFTQLIVKPFYIKKLKK